MRLERPEDGMKMDEKVIPTSEMKRKFIILCVIVSSFFVFKVPYKNMNCVYSGTIQMRKYCFTVENVENFTRGLRHLALHSFLFFEILIDSQEVAKIEQSSA